MTNEELIRRDIERIHRVLMAQHGTLRDHARRSKASEDRLTVLEEFVKEVRGLMDQQRGALKLLKITGALVATAGVVVGILKATGII